MKARTKDGLVHEVASILGGRAELEKEQQIAFEPRCRQLIPNCLLLAIEVSVATPTTCLDCIARVP